MTAICVCGDATITLGAPPVLHAVCHCSNCKRRTGSAFGISAYFDRSAVVATSGATQVYALRHAGHDQRRHFCPRCGTTLYWTHSALPDRIGIAGGCLAGQGLDAPDASVSDANREPWVGLPGHWTVSA